MHLFPRYDKSFDLRLFINCSHVLVCTALESIMNARLSRKHCRPFETVSTQTHVGSSLLTSRSLYQYNNPAFRKWSKITWQLIFFFFSLSHLALSLCRECCATMMNFQAVLCSPSIRSCGAEINHLIRLAFPYRAVREIHHTRHMGRGRKGNQKHTAQERPELYTHPQRHLIKHYHFFLYIYIF